MNRRVLILIPAHNEAPTIAEVLLKLREYAPDFDRLVINDGSSDDTGRIVEALGEKHLRLVCNLGYGQALQTGMKYALQKRYDLVVTFDADGQHRPEDVVPLVRALEDHGADLVIGSRYCKDRRYRGPLGRRVGQRVLSHLTRLFIGHRIMDTTSGFKVMRAATCEAIENGVFMDFHIESIVRLSLLGFSIIEHPVEIRERAHGTSMHSFVSAVAYPLRTLLLTVVATADALLIRRHR